MTTLSVPEYVKGLKPYVPGKPIDEVKEEFNLTDVVKLASNENPLGPSPDAIAAIERSVGLTMQYPEGNAPALRRAVSGLLNVPENQIVFGNGSDELLHILTAAFLQPGDETVQADPSFAMYGIYTEQCNAKPIKVPLVEYTHDLQAMLNAITNRTKIVFIANPNNPTGTLVSEKQVSDFMQNVPDHVIVVFDEAYDEYVVSPDKPNTLKYVAEGRNVVVLRTFSKAYGLAGLRVGYGIMAPEIADVMNRVRSPFNVNLLAQHAATAAIGDQAHIRASVAVNVEGRNYLERELGISGLPFVPTQANFILIDVNRDSRIVFDKLQRLGVIVRAGAGLGLPNHIRVTIGTMPQNMRFIECLRQVLTENVTVN